jgi:hypothetical protein
MREGWICPRCQLSLAPHVNFCDCRDKGGEAGSPAVTLPPAPTGSGAVSVIYPGTGGIVTTTGTGWTATTTTATLALVGERGPELVRFAA